jgi:hypothetical protein
MLIRFLNQGEITVEDSTGGVRGAQHYTQLHSYLFREPDGRRTLIPWSNAGERGVDFRVPGSAATEHDLNGTGRRYQNFSDGMLKGVWLAMGKPRIFRIDP